MPGAWEIPEYEHLNRPQVQPIPGRFGLMVPHTGHVTMHWAEYYRAMQIPEDTVSSLNRGLPIDLSRDAMAYSLVYEKRAEWIGCLDSDVVGPVNMFPYLLGFAQACINKGIDMRILSATYFAKQPYLEPRYYVCAWNKVHDGKQETYQPIDGHLSQNFDKCFPVDVVGFGAIIVHHSVFRELKRPWFMFTTGRFIGGAQLPVPLSEDFYFCEKARKAGIKTHLHMNARCYHLASMAIDDEGAPRLKGETDFPEIHHWGGEEDTSEGTVNM